MVSSNKTTDTDARRTRDRSGGLPWVGIIAAAVVLLAIGVVAWWSAAVNGDVDNSAGVIQARTAAYWSGP